MNQSKIKPNYQVGDKVKCVFTDAYSIQIGVEYIVTYLHEDECGDWMASVKGLDGSRIADGSLAGDWYAYRFEPAGGTTNPSNASSNIIAVNDHTCPTCSNKKVSRAEKSCWLCGGAL